METIRCCKCKIPKTEEEFSWSNKTKGIRNHRCKECQKVCATKYYNKNKEDYLDTQRKYRDRNKLFICEYLKDHSCVDCNESNIVVLQFDHKDPMLKEVYGNMIYNGVNNKWSINRLKKEISLCEVRCANCHLKRHARENGSYRYLFEISK